MAALLIPGRIVWAEIADANGVRKLRPAVVLQHDLQDLSLLVVAVSSFLPQPLPSDHVLLPWHPQRHPKTGLNRPCAAICSWVSRIQTSDVDDSAGIVPNTVFQAILEKLELP